jgi:hypothetical protein
MKLKRASVTSASRTPVRDYLAAEGDHRVYRVTKRKLTSDEAARALATRRLPCPRCASPA